jgi:CBS domain-containing protein
LRRLAEARHVIKGVRTLSFLAPTERLSAVPLTSLPAIVIDTETTGLDVAGDRIIEIGAARLSTTGDTERETYSSMVSPGIAIPPASTNIHGIRDPDVADAPDFADAMAEFANWAGPSLVIGFSIGFDLAIFEAEHARNDLAWRAPRSLDVRHIVEIVAPQLPDMSLELAAEWLGIEVVKRHRALADAQLTAEIFLALIPKLRERGITTLGQLERSCRSLTPRLAEEASAGWHMAGPSTGVAAYSRIDSLPYRYRVGELMSTPPHIVDGDLPLKSALTRMVAENVSSLFIKPDIGGDQFGIITERDVLRAIEDRGAAALDETVGRLGQRPLVSVDADEFSYRALTAMANKGFRHLGVLGDDGALVGALSARDLLRQRAGAAISLGDSIESAQNPTELGLVWSELTIVARALVNEEVDARNIAAIISRELRALTGKACEFAERELVEMGAGPAPLPYALLVLGSGGRGESLLAMDQDNAIVYEDAAPDGEATAWFEMLGTRISDILDEVGVTYCKGGVMASNAAWRSDLAGWRATIGSWISKSQPQDILNSDIFFDAAPAYGDIQLAETLLGEARRAAARTPGFLKLLALNAAEYHKPMGLFGRPKLSDGRIDLKASGIMPIFSAARVVALTNAIEKRSTPERLRAARDRGIATPKTIDNLIQAHGILLGHILHQQLIDMDQGLPLSNSVAFGSLASLEKQELRWALEQIPCVADILGVPLQG